MVTITSFFISLSIVWGRQQPFIIEQTFVEPVEVKAGATFRARRQIKLLRYDCEGILSNSLLIDARGIVHLLEQRSAAPVLRQYTPWREVPVPRLMPAGDAIYRVTVSFSCFPFYTFWPIVVATPDIPDIVIKVITEPPRK